MIGTHRLCLTAQLERLVELAGTLNLPLPWPDGTLDRTARATARSNGIAQGSMRLRVLVSLIQEGKVNLLINTVGRNKLSEREAAVLRRTAVENGVPCLTSLDTAAALLEALEARRGGAEADTRPNCRTIDEYCAVTG